MYKRVVLDELAVLVKDFIDLLQSAYWKNRGTEDAISFTLSSVHSHWETLGNTIRLMFFDFSSAFTTIQPDLIVQKLKTNLSFSVVHSFL